MEILISLFLFLTIRNNKGNNELPAVYILRSSRNSCWNHLMEKRDLPDERFAASSFFQNKSSFRAHQARLLDIFRSNRQPDNGNAWCPRKQTSTSLKEWILVDFKSINIINGIYTKGRGENFIEFVPKIQITYQREKTGRTFQYRTSENQSIISINTDARTQSRTSFIPAIIASSIRIYPYDPHNANMICIKFATYGCSFFDSPVSYSTYEGDVMENNEFHMISTNDRYYDGNKFRKGDKVILENGLGLLADNRAWLGNLDGLKEFYFLGWFIPRNSLDQFISINFRYENKRNFTKLQIFSYKLPTKSIDVFTKINLQFKTNLKLESEVNENIGAKNLQLSRHGGVIFTIKLHYNLGNNVQIQIHSERNKWIFVSEIAFESTPSQEIYSPVSQRNGTKLNVNSLENNKVISKNASQEKRDNKHIPSKDFFPNISGRDIFHDSEKDTTFAVATIVGLILLVIFISIIGIILYKMKQKIQYKKNSKMQYMIGNEIGSIYQQYSQTEKIKHFLTPTLQQTHSLASDTSSFDCPQGRILDATVYSSLPHKTSKETKSIRDDETYLLKEYNKISSLNPSSALNISPYSNNENSLKNTVFTKYSWSTDEPAYKNSGQEYASATLFPSPYPGIQYKRSSGSSIFLHDYKQIPNNSPYHMVTASPLFSNSPLGRSQLPSTIQIITNPYLNHVDNAPHKSSIEFSTPMASQRSLNLLLNDSNITNPYPLSKNSFLCWMSSEANFFPNIDFNKLMQIQSVCGHISFGSADFDSLGYKRSTSFNDSKLPLLPISSITTKELICQGQYGQLQKAVIKESIIRPNNSTESNNESNRKVSFEKTNVILTILNENSLPDIRSQFQDEIRIRLRLSDPNVVAVLAMISDSIDANSNRLVNHQLGIITESYMNLHHYIRSQTTDQIDIPKSPTEFSYTIQNPSSLNNYLNYGSLIFIGSQIASGMKHMEEQGILHRDLACRSCMINSNLQVKIGNGGRQMGSPYEADYLSIPLSEYTTIHLPIRWMAPESLFNAKFSSKSDVWAFGVTLWEVLTHCNQQPYFYWSNSQVMENLYNVLLAQNSQFHYLTRPKICPKEIYDMIRECWHPIEDYRPSFHEIHMFLQRKCIGFYSPDIGFKKSMT